MGRPSSTTQLSRGYLGAIHSATPFRAGDTPIDNLVPPKGLSRTERDEQMRTLMELNGEFRDRYSIDAEISARLKAYELAARLQMEAPGVVDLSREPRHVLDLYGIGQTETDPFGRQLLLARRLAEKGVRSYKSATPGEETDRGTRIATWRAMNPCAGKPTNRSPA
jgi:hypothetical protein